jgi:hypothetical protein
LLSGGRRPIIKMKAAGPDGQIGLTS